MRQNSIRFDLYRELIGRNNVQWMRVHEILQIIQFVAPTCWPIVVGLMLPTSLARLAIFAILPHDWRPVELLMSPTFCGTSKFYYRWPSLSWDFAICNVLHMLAAIIPSVHCRRGNIKYTQRQRSEFNLWISMRLFLLKYTHNKFGIWMESPAAYRITHSLVQSSLVVGSFACLFSFASR